MNGQIVNVYFDGFNFYNGLRDKNWRNFYWLDLVEFSEKIIKKLDNHHQLNKVYYFSAPPYNHSSKERRQKIYFDANGLNSKFHLILGYHKDKSKFCNTCKTKIIMSEEKQTDVNIALEMLKNAVKKTCQLSILVSGDTDLIPIIKSIKEIDTNHKVMIFFPPERKTNQMIQYVDGWRDLSHFNKIFKNCLFQDMVGSFRIPTKWKNYQ